MMSSSLPGTTPSCTIRSCPSAGALSSNKWVPGTPSPRSLQTVSQLLMDTTTSSSSAQVRVAMTTYKTQRRLFGLLVEFPCVQTHFHMFPGAVSPISFWMLL